ncbi:efflux RND transporter permease subunit [bacterium]|nr:efflux RND transporter permease subunit [bacterium]
MKNAIRAFIKYPILGNVVLVAIFLFGWVGFTQLKTTFFPLIPSRMIMINASYPGASPEEIEEAIVLKIEDNLKGVTGIERVESVSRENSCSITVTVLMDYDIHIVIQDVKDAVNQVSTFPAGMERITIYRQEPRNFAIDFVLAGDVDLATLKQEGRRAERALLSSEGVSKVALSGFPAEEIEVSVRERDMRAYGLTFTEIETAVRQGNIKITGGKIKGKREEFLIRANEKGYRAAELARHVVRATPDGTIVRLGDVADLKDRWSEDPNRVYHNGEPAVLVTVQNTNQEDLFHVTSVVREYVDRYNSTHTDVQAYVVRDGSEIINERIDLMTSNMILGVVLVVLFLSLSLNPRMSFWVALGIPVSFAGMVMLAPLYGMTINVMSLLGMILVLGILVDDGIVIAENIYQHFERGAKPVDAALKGSFEVLPSVLASVSTTVVIFLTFFFVQGGMGDRTRDLAFVVVAALLISLVEAAFVLPGHIAHSKALCSSKKPSRLDRWVESWMHFARDRMYAPVLRYTLKHPYVAVSVPVAIMIITLGAMRGGILKTTFFPNIEGRNTAVMLEMPAGTPAAVTDSLLASMEPVVWRINDVYRDETRQDIDIVLSQSRRVGGGTHQGSLQITLVSSEKRKWDSREITNRLRQMVGTVPGAEKLEFGGGVMWGKPVSIALASNELDQLRSATEELKSELANIDLLRDIVDDDPPGLREVSISLKEKAFAMGLTTAEVLSQVRSGFFGGEAQRLLRGIDEVKIWVRYDETDRTTLENLESMRIRFPGGEEYPLSQIADFTIERGVMAVNHIDAQRVVKVEADVTDPKASVPALLSQIRSDILPDIKSRYPDISFLFEGQSRENEKTMKSIMTTVPAILLVMFLIVTITFRSFLQAGIVFLLIPFSLIGVLWGHYLQGYIVSILSWFGAIALIGIVVNDSLVLISSLNLRLKNGEEFAKALYETGRSRFRPVLLTSLTTIAGLGPLVFMKSHQAQFLSPMAISVAYGLVFGTLLTLLVLPGILSVTNHGRQWFAGLLGRKNITAESVEPAVREERFLDTYSGHCDDGEEQA